MDDKRLKAKTAAQCFVDFNKCLDAAMQAYLTNTGLKVKCKSVMKYLTRMEATMRKRLKRATDPIRTKIKATLAGLRATKQVKKAAKTPKPKPKAQPKLTKREQESANIEYHKRCTQHFNEWLGVWMRAAIDMDRLIFAVSLGALGLLYSFMQVSVHNDSEAMFELWKISTILFTITAAWGLLAPHFDKFFISECCLQTLQWTPEATKEIQESARTRFVDNLMMVLSRGMAALCIAGLILLFMLATERTGF